MSDINIIVVDDSSGILDCLKAIFDNNGKREIDLLLKVNDNQTPEFNLRAYSDPDSAEDAIRAFVNEGVIIHVVFIDIRMPPSSGGVPLAQKIKKIDDNILICFITAYSDQTPMEINKILGSRFLWYQKPFNDSEIWQAAVFASTLR